MPGLSLSQAQMLNLDTVIDNLYLSRTSNTNFASTIDGTQGITVQKLQNESGAYITFSDNLTTDQKITIMNQMLNQSVDPAA